MAIVGPDRAQIRVYTYKEGLLSAVAHDLQIRATRFEIHIDGDQIRAEIDPSSLEVVSAMKNGSLDASALKASDKQEIAGNIRDDVLHVSTYPGIRFESTRIEPATLSGRLTLHGTTREVRLALRDAPGRRIAEVRLDQREYGIKPYAAMLGALKVAPVLKVEVELPWP